MTTADAPLIGGKYRLGKVIAESEMCRIHEAVQATLLRPLAVRLFKAESTARWQRRLLNEARLCALLEHPNVLEVYEIGVSEEEPFVAMELLHGEKLRARVQRDGPLDLSDAARIGFEILDALAAAHEHSATHRSLSADAVFLDRRAGTTVAKLANLEEGDERAAHVDLYSAGVTCYEMLTGDMPFTTSGEAGFADMPPSPGEKRGELGLDVDAFFMRALAHHGDARFRTADEMRDAWSSLSAFEAHLQA